MPWNPNVYDQFKQQRQQPFYDLVALIHPKPQLRIVDLGCGTGELTLYLAEHFPDAEVLGIDNSAEMLSLVPTHPRLSFAHTDIEAFLNTPQQWDVVVANASLQWLDKHATLWPQLVGKLAPRGQLAVQMPSQTENRLNQLLLALVRQAPYQQALAGWQRNSPVLDLDDYAQILFQQGASDMALYQKVYPQIAKDSDELYQFIAGSALIPYMERLPAALQQPFVRDFKQHIARAFPQQPALYAFKRLLMHATF